MTWRVPIGSQWCHCSILLSKTLHKLSLGPTILTLHEGRQQERLLHLFHKFSNMADFHFHGHRHFEYANWSREKTMSLNEIHCALIGRNSSRIVYAALWLITDQGSHLCYYNDALINQMKVHFTLTELLSITKESQTCPLARNSFVQYLNSTARVPRLARNIFASVSSLSFQFFKTFSLEMP